MCGDERGVDRMPCGRRNKVIMTILLLCICALIAVSYARFNRIPVLFL